MRNCIRGFLDIVDPEKVGIVDPGHMNPLPAAFDDNAFVKEHTYSHPLQVGDHADRIMVAQNAVHRSFQSLVQPRHLGKGVYFLPAATPTNPHLLGSESGSILTTEAGPDLSTET